MPDPGDAGDPGGRDDDERLARWARSRRAWTAVEIRLFAICTFVLEPLWAVGPAALPLLLIPGTFALICVFLVGYAGLRLVSVGIRRFRSGGRSVADRSIAR